MALLSDDDEDDNDDLPVDDRKVEICWTITSCVNFFFLLLSSSGVEGATDIIAVLLLVIVSRCSSELLLKPSLRLLDLEVALEALSF